MKVFNGAAWAALISKQSDLDASQICQQANS